MQYHALSLLELGDHVTVSLVGYTGEELIDPLGEYRDSANDRLNVIRFCVPSFEPLKRVKILYFAYRVLSLSIYLLYALLLSVPSRHPVDGILLQNPPALPLLAVALLVSRLRGVLRRHQPRPRVIVDWHNLGFSMLDNPQLKRIAKAYEFYFAPMADGHLTVTYAMKDYLLEQLPTIPSTSISVLYDCPPVMFEALDTSQQHAIMSKLHDALVQATPRSWQLQSLDSTNETILTSRQQFSKTRFAYAIRRNRPALITSSTSWTPDEDFGLLLDALVLLDAKVEREASSLKVLVVVTGKGPQKAFYETKMSQLRLTSVAIQTIWLEPGDYPKLLACADVAVSLHTSTSGLDLPMKILDSYGCQVPVCARNFDCLDELVQDGHNGRIFRDQYELSEQLWEVLSPLTEQPDAAPHQFGDLKEYSENLKGRMRWQDNWTEHALPVLLSSQ